jgi:pyruvate/2-oxoglutarate dehydrogenase complex dihydrolipoamide dehydrogenase (E3) component
VSDYTPCYAQAKNILIAVGGRAFKAPIEGAEHSITSDDILVLPKVPGV